MAKTNRVNSARTSPGKCGRCGIEILKGQPYVWMQLFRSAKQIRCAAPDCRFRESERTNSKMSAAYAAREDCEDTVAGWDGIELDDIAQALRDAAQAITEVADEYNQAAEAISDRFENSPAAEECEEKANALEEWASELESAADNLPDKPSGDEDEIDAEALAEHAEKEDPAAAAKASALDNWKQEVVDAANEALGSFSL